MKGGVVWIEIFVVFDDPYLLHACLAGPVNANQGLFINAPVNSSTGRRRRLYSYDDSPLGSPSGWGQLVITLGPVGLPIPLPRVENADDTNDTFIPLLVVNEEEAYFGGKIAHSYS